MVNFWEYFAPLFLPKEGIPPAGRENRGVAGVVPGQGDGVPGGVATGVIVLNIPDNDIDYQDNVMDLTDISLS